MAAVELLAEVDCAKVLALGLAGVSPSLPWMSWRMVINPNVWKQHELVHVSAQPYFTSMVGNGLSK